jgi:hypothetical protein
MGESPYEDIGPKQNIEPIEDSFRDFWNGTFRYGTRAYRSQLMVLAYMYTQSMALAYMYKQSSEGTQTPHSSDAV